MIDSAISTIGAMLPKAARWPLKRMAVLLTLLCGAAFAIIGIGGSGALYTLHTDGYPMALTVDQAGHAITVGDNGAVTVLDIARGAVLRAFATDPRDGFSSLAVDTQLGRAFVSLGTIHDPRNRAVLAVDLRTGRAWPLAAIVGNEHRFAIDEARDWLFVTDITRNAVDVVDIRTGRLRRVIPVGGPPLQVALDQNAGRVAVEIGGLQPHRLSIVDTVRGRMIRSIVLTDYIGLLVDARTHTFITSQDRGGLIRIIDARSGRILHSFSSGIHPVSVVIDGRTQHLFITNWSTRSLKMLDARTGVVLKLLTLPVEPVAMAIDDAAGRLVVTGQVPYTDTPFGYHISQLLFNVGHLLGRNATISVLDTRTGALLKTMRVGQWAGLVSIDAPDRRAAVITDDGVAVYDTRTLYR